MKDEKQIEKILMKHGIETFDWAPGIAKEIASLYEGWYPGEFVEWKDSSFNCQCFGKDQYVPRRYNGTLTLPDLFKYWRDNVEGK